MINPRTGRVDISYQQMMDEKMCRPGYRWTGEPLNRCLPAVAWTPNKPGTPSPQPDNPETPPPTPPLPEEIPDAPMPSPEQAIAMEKAVRKQKTKA